MAKKTKKKTSGLGDKSVAELQAMARDLDKEVFDLRNTLALNKKLEKPHLLKAKRREKARALTFLTKKMKGEGAAL